LFRFTASKQVARQLSQNL